MSMTDPVLLLPLTKAEYGITRDVAGNVHPAHGAIAVETDKMFGSVLSFDGIDDCIALPPESLATGSALTVSFWANGGVHLPSQNSVILANDTNNLRLLNIHLPWSDERVYFDAGQQGGYDRIQKKASPDQYRGNWHFWAFTKNLATGEMCMYLDGQLWHRQVSRFRPFTPAAFFHLGGIPGRFYQGKIAMLRVYHTALSAEEIQRDMAEKTIHAYSDWYRLLKTDAPNYFEVTNAFQNYFRIHPFVKSPYTKEYKVWAKRVNNHYDGQGNLTRSLPSADDVATLQTEVAYRFGWAATPGRSWSCIGPEKIDLNAVKSGSFNNTTQGVIRNIVCDPRNPNKVFAGSEWAGLWLSEDKGATWRCVTERLLVTQVRQIAICLGNTNIIYAATDGGPIKSTDGGRTFNFTLGLNWEENYPYDWYDPPSPKGTAMGVHPYDANQAIFGANTGFYRTTDGGRTWVEVMDNAALEVDLAYHPTDPRIVYASVMRNDQLAFQRSSDGGATWTRITSGFYSGQDKLTRFCIAVTPSAPNHVYVLAASERTSHFFKSTDAGLNFTNLNIVNILARDITGRATKTEQAWWDMALTVSPVDPNFVVAGGIYPWISTDGGANWRCPNASMHTDFHAFAITNTPNPWGGTEESLWAAGDFGVFYSTNRLSHYENKGFGIVAQEIHGFDQGWKSDILAAGLDHGPIQIRDDQIYDGWFVWEGGDASSCFVNKGDDRYIYVRSSWNEHDHFKVIRSNNKYDMPVQEKFNASIPLAISPMEIWDHAYYFSFFTIHNTTIRKTMDHAMTWDPAYDHDFLKIQNAWPIYVTTSYSDPMIAYLITRPFTPTATSKLWKTTDGGRSWNDVSPPSHLTRNQIMSSVTIDGEHPDVVWVSVGGRQNQVKVIKTTDGSATWMDYSGPINNQGTLSIFAANDIGHQMGTDGGVYLATDAGVFYRNNTMARWEPYNAGLPAATVAKFVHINYAKEKIRIGTDRGIWECDLYEKSRTIARPMADRKKVDRGGHVQFVDHSVALENATYQWRFDGGTPATSNLEKPMVTYGADGSYAVTLTVTDAHGTDTRTYRDFIICGTGVGAGSGSGSGSGSGAGSTATKLPTTGWVATADSAMPGWGPEYTIDNNPSIFWITQPSNHPHNLFLDMKQTNTVSGIRYYPRQDTSEGRIKDYVLYKSDDGVNWQEIRRGSWPDTAFEQEVTFPPVSCRHIRLQSLSSVDGSRFTVVGDISVLGTAAPSESATSIPKTNWVATADSSQYQFEPKFAVDADPGMVWCSANSPYPAPYPHYLQVSLGAAYNVAGFRYHPYPGIFQGYIKDFEFQVSNDGLNWNTVKRGRWSYTRVGEVKEETFAGVSARHVRLRGLSELHNTHLAIVAELEVLARGASSVGVVMAIPKIGWVATASSSQDGWEPHYTHDGNPALVWHSQWAPYTPPFPHFIEFDLGQSHAIAGFRCQGRPNKLEGAIKDFEFQISADRFTWITATQGTWTYTRSDDVKEEKFPPITGRFVKLIAKSEINGQTGACVAEFDVLALS